MLPWPEVRTALLGAAQLACFNVSGFKHLGVTGRDAWRSFFAAIIVGPMFLVWIGAHGTEYPEAPLIYAIPFEALSYIIGWFLFPVIVWHVSEPMDCRQHFAKFVTSYNWSAVIQNALFISVNLILIAIGASEGALSFFGFALLIYVLFYGWFIARHALGLTSSRATLIIALDMAVTLAWETVSGILIAG